MQSAGEAGPHQQSQGRSDASGSAAPSSGNTTSSVQIAGSSMPLPLAPYPPHHQFHPPPPGTQGQLICSGCRTLLVYPHGANNVRCALCSFVTAVPAHGTEMAQLVCGGCRTLLMYVRGASSVQCSCCNTVNLAMEAANQVAHINCGGCGITLMYAYGAQSVKCALCQFVTTLVMGSMRLPMGNTRPPFASNTAPAQIQTVVVENPMTVDDTGKLVSNVAVGVTTDKS